jgi:hypothetical protein
MINQIQNSSFAKGELKFSKTANPYNSFVEEHNNMILTLRNVDFIPSV